MNNTLETAYKILYNLENKKKVNFMGQLISPKKLNVDDEKWLEVIMSLLEDGYISNVIIKENILGEKNIDIENARITLKGAQYLQENSAMKKIQAIATNTITIMSNVIK